MNAVLGCSAGADNLLGPRIDKSCRSFDFTLLFEDAFFSVIPACVFLLLLPVHLWQLIKMPTKVKSYALATWKLVRAPTLLDTGPSWTDTLC